MESHIISFLWIASRNRLRDREGSLATDHEVYMDSLKGNVMVIEVDEIKYTITVERKV